MERKWGRGGMGAGRRGCEMGDGLATWCDRAPSRKGSPRGFLHFLVSNFGDIGEKGQSEVGGLLGVFISLLGGLLFPPRCRVPRPTTPVRLQTGEAASAWQQPDPSLSTCSRPTRRDACHPSSDPLSVRPVISSLQLRTQRSGKGTSLPGSQSQWWGCWVGAPSVGLPQAPLLLSCPSFPHTCHPLTKGTWHRLPGR